MKYNPALRSTADVPTDTATDWEIEDLTEIQHVGGATWSNRWLGVVIAIAVAVVGFGFVGRWSSGDPTRQARAIEPARDMGADEGGEPSTLSGVQGPFELTSPDAGASIEGGLVNVRGIAARPLGSVHVAVWLGDAVLGWTNVDVTSAGPVAVTIRVFAPPFTAPVELRINGGPSHHGEAFATTIGLRLHAASPVNIWRTRVATSAAGTTLLVEGCGRASTEEFELKVRSADGTILASTRASIGQEDGRPGSIGGRLIGLGSFTARLTVAGSLPPGPVSLSLTWRDSPTADPLEISLILRESSKPGVAP